MNKKVFLDTNIILDFLDEQRKYHHQAKILITELIIHNITIVISEDMLTTIFYIDKNSHKVLEFFKKIIQKWSLSSFGKKVIEEAIELSIEKELDFEDVLQCLCAKENGCEALVTMDKGFFDCGVEIYDIDGYLRVLKG